MPEIPDLVVYLERLSACVLGDSLERLTVANPFVLRSVTPSPADLAGRRVERLGRLGKRLIISLEGDVHIVIHLMIAGRLLWRAPGSKSPGKRALAEWVFSRGSLYLTEAGSTRRASVHLVTGADALATFDRGGLEPLEIDAATFVERLRLENHTLKRTLTDPRLFSGIGNAYSDEILHRAGLSPLTLTSRLPQEDAGRLHQATQAVLLEWTERLRTDAGDGFPEKMTAFREGMAVHGRFGKPCPVCGAPVQRIRYATNETNYCARCQTGGRLLADRALSRLLKKDWPRSLDDIE